MKKIKIIDLLNKIANGEEVPEKIKFKNKVFIYDKQEKLYRNEEVSSNTLKHMFYLYYLEKILNDEVEIIEDAEEDKEIEKAKLKLFEDTGEAVTYDRVQEYNEYNIKELKRVTDEVIDAVNKLNK